jgi:8-oxo-dGTP pyrophosphatase MutT (NUDIX family)
MENKPSPNYYAAVVVINSDGQVLLGKRKEDGIWTTPGGGAEPGEENPAKTAVRELFEEAGIPANVAFLQPIESIATRNGKLCHVFLYVCGTNVIPSSKLDPDEEVGKWKFFSIDQIPNGLKEDERRFKSVRNGYMKFYGIVKSLTENLEKGGKPAQIGETRTFGGKQYQKMGNGDWRQVVHAEEKQLKQIESEKVQSLTSKLKDKVAQKNEITQAEKHYNDIKNQSVIEGKETRSGKPMFTNVDSALAHSYEPEDFREVGNIFYDRATAMAQNINKLKTTGQKVDPFYEKIKRENMQTAKRFLSQAATIDRRRAQTDYNQKVKKSTIAVGHADGAEINTADYSMERQNSMENGWMERISQIMADYQYGEVPRVIPMDAGDLYLVKVEEGIYTGMFKTITEVEDGQLEDNAKVRLERMTVPTIVQFCLAKEWIRPFDVTPEIAPQQAVALTEKLAEPTVTPTTQDPTDRKLEILRLLDKLTN